MKKPVNKLRFVGIKNDEDENKQIVFEVRKKEMMMVLPEEYKELVGKKIVAIEPMHGLFPDGDCILISLG